MNAAAKRFLAGYFAAYLLIAVVLNATLGPPAMSEEFLGEYKRDYDHYLSITKSNAYKLWSERPALHPPEGEEAEQFNFVESFEALPAFQAEKSRRMFYDIAFDFLRAAMVIILVVRFGRKPFAKFVGAQINEIRHRIERVENARTAAENSRLESEKKLEALPKEREALRAETNERIAKEKERIAESAKLAMANIEQETRDRKQYEAMIAERAVKRELVDAAVNVILESYKHEISDASESAFIDDFLGEIGARK